jgi:hypothetical protein
MIQVFFLLFHIKNDRSHADRSSMHTREGIMGPRPEQIFWYSQHEGKMDIQRMFRCPRASVCLWKIAFI